MVLNYFSGTFRLPLALWIIFRDTMLFDLKFVISNDAGLPYGTLTNVHVQKVQNDYFSV